MGVSWMIKQYMLAEWLNNNVSWMIKQYMWQWSNICDNDAVIFQNFFYQTFVL
jgi:hypothetical protein